MKIKNYYEKLQNDAQRVFDSMGQHSFSSKKYEKYEHLLELSNIFKKPEIVLLKGNIDLETPKNHYQERCKELGFIMEITIINGEKLKEILDD